MLVAMSYAPARLDLTIARGTDLLVEIACKDSEADPVDLTGWTATAHARRNPDKALAFDLGAVLHDDSAGLVRLTMDKAVTAALTAGDFYWDLILEDSDGFRHPPIVAGRVRVLTPITQPDALP